MDVTPLPGREAAEPAPHTNEGWDPLFNDFVDFGSPADADHSDVVPGVKSHKWLSVPETWEVSETTAESDDPSRDYNIGVDAAQGVDMQKQINELRETIALLVGERQHSRAYHEPHLGDQPSNLLNNSGPDLFASFSFPQPSSGQSSGYATPVERLASPFDLPDDSPIYSRRSSAASIGSLHSNKRGQRILSGYSCNSCDARFDVPGELKHHERKHIPKSERPHACQECGQRFLYPKDVSRHERQVHNIIKPGHETPRSRSSSVAGGKRPECQQYSPEEQKKRRRHWQICQAAIQSRERRVYIRQLEQSVKRKDDLLNEIQHSRNGTPDSRRRHDSFIPDIVTEDVDKAEGGLPRGPESIEPPGSYIAELQAQLNSQQQTISRLQQDLQARTEEAAASLAQSNAMAELLSLARASAQKSNLPPLSHDNLTSVTVDQARGWLAAIEILLTTWTNKDSLDHVQTFQALQHLAATLDHVSDVSRSRH